MGDLYVGGPSSYVGRDEVGNPATYIQPLVEDGEWWGGAQLRMVAVAIAATAAITASQVQAAQAAFARDPDFAPYTAPAVPAASPAQVRLFTIAAPRITVPAPWRGDVDFVGTAAPNVEDDEEGWQSPAPAEIPVVRLPLWFGQVDERPAPLAVVVADEDGWANPVPPPPFPNTPELQRLPTWFGQVDDRLTPAATIALDDGQGPARRLTLGPAGYVRLTPPTGGVGAPAAAPGAFEDDRWSSGVGPSWGWPVPLALAADDERPTPPAALTVEEQAWQSGVAPVWGWVVPRVGGGEDERPMPAAALTVDEDYWQSPAALLALREASWQPVWLLDTAESGWTTIDEDYWPTPVRPVWGWPVPAVASDPGDLPVAVVPLPVDDAPWINPVPPVAGTLQGFRIWDNQQDDRLTVAAPLPCDEGEWKNPVAPVVGALIGLPPWIGPVDEITTPVAPLTVDDEPWIGRPVPVEAYAPVWLFDTSESAPAVDGVLEDDAAPPLVAPVWGWPVPRLVWPADELGIPATPLGVEDTPWTNPVAPVVATLRGLQIWDGQPDELGTPVAPLGVDDTPWTNPVAPVPATLLGFRVWDGQPDERPYILPLGVDEQYWLILKPVPWIPQQLPPVWGVEAEALGLSGTVYLGLHITAHSHYRYQLRAHSIERLTLAAHSVYRLRLTAREP